MLIEKHLDEKYVIIWVTHADKHDIRIQESIRKIIHENHQNKIKTVIFSSGHECLPSQTAKLIEYFSEKAPPEKKIDRDSIDLFTTMWYNYLKGNYPFNEVRTHDQGTAARSDFPCG